MKPEEQIEAIALSQGYTLWNVDDETFFVSPNEKWQATAYWKARGVKKGDGRPLKPLKDLTGLPNYLSDLNAIHNVVMSLTANQRDMVNLKLYEIVRGDYDYSEIYDMDATINATAAERAQAYLETIKKYKK